jgi:tripartite-type tricarboxylate transporter receptor subunit TctC
LKICPPAAWRKCWPRRRRTAIRCSPNILVVHPELPVTSAGELIALARARPGQLRFTSSGSGSSTHLAGELFRVMAGVDMRHTPYKGNVAAVAAVAAGEAQVMFSATTAARPHIAAGRLRALAVTSAQPSALFPALPTVAASGLPGYESASLLGLFAPAHTPEPILRMLNAHVLQCLAAPATRQRLLDEGLEAVGTPADELAATMRAEMSRLGKIIRDAGIRA